MSAIIIRAGVESDLAGLIPLYNHYIETSAATFDIAPYTVEMRRSWFEQFAESGPHRIRVAEEDGRVRGYASSGTFRTKAAYARTVEVSVYLAHDATGSGLGGRLYESLFTALADEEVHRAYAGITLPNEASLALHRRLGFEEIGDYDEVGYKFDRYWSVRWLEKRLR